MVNSENITKNKYVIAVAVILFVLVAIVTYNYLNKQNMIGLEKRRLQQGYERTKQAREKWEYERRKNYSTPVEYDPFVYTPEQIKAVDEAHKQNIHDLETDPDLYFYKKQEREKHRPVEVIIDK